MLVNPADLGTAVCRAIMRDMDDKPILLELHKPSAPSWPVIEATSAGERVIAAQWCVVLLPLPHAVGVRAHLKFWGMGIWDRAVLTDGGNKENLFVPYPKAMELIGGDDYYAALRDAVDRALAAVEADRAKIKAEEG